MTRPEQAMKALQVETDFLAGVEGNFETAKGALFRGSIWQTGRSDDVDRLKGLMATNRNYDRETLKSLPANRRFVLRGFERRFWFGRRPTGVAVASVLCPLQHFASTLETSPPPIGLGELVDHVRQLSSKADVPHVIGVCSPSGFTPEARSARLDLPNVTVVLIEPDEQGGWSAAAVGEGVDPRIVRLFDPEGATKKLERAKQQIRERSADLLTGGLDADSIARATQLPGFVVRQAFESVCMEDSELRILRRKDDWLLYRGAPASRQEKPMGVLDRLRSLFSGPGRESEKLNVLAERRAELAQRRDRIYEDIGRLEQKEAELLAQGKAASSDVPRRRLAAQLVQLRKDIGRQNTSASMLNQQINIIATNIHNLTMLSQGQLAALPDREELALESAEVQEMLETLRDSSEEVGRFATGMDQISTSDEELAVLKEFAGESTARTVQAPVEPSAQKSAASGPVGPMRNPAPAANPPRVEAPRANPPPIRKADPEPT